MNVKSDIKQKALSLGFDAVGISTAEPVQAKQVEYFQHWLSAGFAAEMKYMHRNVEKRFDPGKLLTGAKSVICVALNYRLRQEEETENPPVRIARFGQYEDYHPFIKERLSKLAEFIRIIARQRKLPEKQTPTQSARVKFKACVDSVPIAERTLAQRAGLGFVGRNHMLIHPELGSQILLGELITTFKLEPDEPFEQIPCGDCGRCIRACPTGALAADGTFDSRKCISYQTIEAPDSSPKRERRDNYIFGCDECILACPHELGKPPRQNMKFQHRPEWQKLTPEQIQNMTEDEFQKTFEGSGFIRLGLRRLKRNCSQFKL